MNKKFAPFLLIAVLAILVLVIRQCRSSTVKEPARSSKTNTAEPASGRGLNRNASLLYYSKHAKCRMQCRHISQAEVEEVLQNGKVNYRKSDLQGSSGPEYALEDITSDGQKVRIVFAPKKTQTTVVTVIDLEKEWECPSCD